jgi:hypothetical protein
MPEHIWRQADRETGLVKARRDLLLALGAVDGLSALSDGHLDRLRHEPVFYARALTPLFEALSLTRILLEAYEYFLARCQEAGMSLDDAQAAWQVHSSPEFEGELLDAERYGPNAMAMIDQHILARLGIGPNDVREGDTGH